jgi:hypothetical protein
MTAGRRAGQIVDVLLAEFGDLMALDPAAFQGHRTAESQRALQAHADPWLGFTELFGVGQLVAEVSPYAADLDWSDVNEPDEPGFVQHLVDFAHAYGRARADHQIFVDLFRNGRFPGL